MKTSINQSFTMSKLEFTNSLEMYINSKLNKVFAAFKLLNLVLNHNNTFRLYKSEHKEIFTATFNIIEKNNSEIKIIGNISVRKNWQSSILEPFVTWAFILILAPLYAIGYGLNNISSKNIKVAMLIICFLYLVIASYKIYKYIKKRYEVRKQNNIKEFINEINEIFEFIRNQRAT